MECTSSNPAKSDKAKDCIRRMEQKNINLTLTDKDENIKMESPILFIDMECVLVDLTMAMKIILVIDRQRRITILIGHW